MRSGMGTLVSELRGLTFSGTADYTIAGVAYWTNDQLQTKLDASRADIYYEQLTPVSTELQGTVYYFDYYFALPYPERAESGTTAWRVTDSAGSVIGTASYTVNYEARQIRFSSDQAGSARYLDYRSYNLYRAASRTVREKMAHAASRFDIKIDNHSLKLSQLLQNYKILADTWDSQGGVYVIEKVRDDVLKLG